MTEKIPYCEAEAGLLVWIKTYDSTKRRINDKPLKPTFHPEWWMIEGESASILSSAHAGTHHINRRYVLINDAVAGVDKRNSL